MTRSTILVTYLAALLFAIGCTKSQKFGPDSVAGHFWRCDVEQRFAPGGMTLNADTSGNWNRVKWEGHRGPGNNWVEWNIKSTFVQEGGMVKETIHEVDGEPSQAVNVFDVIVDKNKMQMTYRMESGKPGISWFCEDRPTEYRLLAGSFYCATYNAALSGRQIDRSGNQYVPMPNDCARLERDITPEWSEEDGGITRFGVNGRKFYTWSSLVES